MTRPGQLSHDDALHFLDAVKATFQEDCPEKYNRFLDIMTAFKNDTCTVQECMVTVQTLFEGHPHLAEGFQVFLPPGLTICPFNSAPPSVPAATAQWRATFCDGWVPSDDEIEDEDFWNPSWAKTIAAEDTVEVAGDGDGDGVGRASSSVRAPAEFNRAINYVNLVKRTFADQPELYQSFLNTLQEFQTGSGPIDQVYHEMVSIFHRHPAGPALLPGFTEFIPTSARDRLGLTTQPPFTPETIPDSPTLPRYEPTPSSSSSVVPPPCYTPPMPRPARVPKRVSFSEAIAVVDDEARPLLGSDEECGGVVDVKSEEAVRRSRAVVVAVVIGMLVALVLGGLHLCRAV
ncbi:Transcriptional regulatory protein sin3 [Borealophlyctis nickersoniae]|nr:Transcriptional regulatory protein sin3 [Borealophlyctis nickersoniae]